MIGTSPPRPKCEISVTAAAKVAATPASTALPPRTSMRMAASAANCRPAAATPSRPLTSARYVADPRISSAVMAGGRLSTAICRASAREARVRVGGSCNFTYLASGPSWAVGPPAPGFPGRGGHATTGLCLLGGNRELDRHVHEQPARSRRRDWNVIRPQEGVQVDRVRDALSTADLGDHRGRLDESRAWGHEWQRNEIKRDAERYEEG